MGCHHRMGIVLLPAVLQLPHCGMVLFSSPRWADYKVKLHCLTSVPGVCSNNSKCNYFKKKIEMWRENKEPPTSKHLKPHHKETRCCQTILFGRVLPHLLWDQVRNSPMPAQGNKTDKYLATSGPEGLPFPFLH